MEINAYCAGCLLKKWLGAAPKGTDAAKAALYDKRVRAIVEDDPRESSPEKDYRLNLLYADMFGPRQDYDAIKRHFNALTLSLVPRMRAGIDAAEDPLRRAIQYAMTGNFIDFAAMDSVDEGKLIELIDASKDFPVDDAVLNAFRRDLARARRLTVILDNCGEIVMDKVLMQVIGRLYHHIEKVAVVKGGPIVNDATMEDADQVNLSEAAEVIDTGCPIAGVPEGRISVRCKQTLEASDIIISKGQANYETLCGCGMNVYYIFMCKCRLFMDRFNVPQYSGLFVREREGAPWH